MGMGENREWYVKSESGKVYGPADVDQLAAWAREGRIEPGAYLSRDRVEWTSACRMDELKMQWLVETRPGKVFGPFTREVVINLFNSGTINASVRVYRLHELAIDQDSVPVVRIVERKVRVEVPVEKVVEKIVEKRVEVPVVKEVIKEVRVEVPVEKIVEKEVIKEVRVEVPVERIVEKIVEAPVRAEVVVPEVMDAADAEQPKATAHARSGREQLAALEAAARRELAQGRKFGLFK